MTVQLQSVRSFAVTAIDVGLSAIRGPELFWMSDWGLWYPLQFTSVLVQGPNLNLLVNTSPPDDLAALHREMPGVEWADPESPAFLRRRPEQHLTTALNHVGITPDDITHVVLSPLELYATGTLDHFKSARIAVSERGWLHFHATHSHPHDQRWRSFLRPTLVGLVTEDWDRVVLLKDEDEVVPGVRTWWAGTHHRSTLVVEIESSVGTISVSDAFFYYENIEDGRVIGLCENLYEAEATYRRVRNSARYVLPLHDPKVFERHPAGVVAASRA